jgi:hypothetical protein
MISVASPELRLLANVARKARAACGHSGQRAVKWVSDFMLMHKEIYASSKQDGGGAGRLGGEVRRRGA